MKKRIVKMKFFDRKELKTKTHIVVTDTPLSDLAHYYGKNKKKDDRYRLKSISDENGAWIF